MTAPPYGGLSLFLDDLVHARKSAGDVTFHATISDSRQIEIPFADLAKTLSAAAGDNIPVLDGELETLFDCLSRFREACPNKIAVAILDVTEALRAVEADPQRAGSRAIADPLLRRLRTLVNWLQDREGPMAIIVGWDDRFLQWAPTARADDVLQRYSPAEVLFADFELGRAAWSNFRAIFEEADFDVAGEFPGICGSGIPAGAILAAARTKGIKRIDADFLLDILVQRGGSEARATLDLCDPKLIADLCLRDKELEVEPPLGTLIELRSEGGYVASRELYERFGLVPPREIVSFSDSVKQRLEERDPDLGREVAAAVALLLDKSEPLETDFGWDINLKNEFVPTHLHDLDVRLIVSMNPQLDAGQLTEGSGFIAGVERDPKTAGRKLLLVLHHDSNFVGPLQRALEAHLEQEKVSARPHGVAVHPTTGRPFAALATIELTAETVVEAAWLRRDRNRTAGLSTLLRDNISRHYRQMCRHMPLLGPESFAADSLAALINAESGHAPLDRKTGDSLVAIGSIERTDNGEYAWRWTEDGFWSVSLRQGVEIKHRWPVASCLILKIGKI